MNRLSARLAALALCGGGGYAGGALLQAGRFDLALCAWLVAALVSLAWILGDVEPTDDAFSRLLRRLLGWDRR